MESFKSDQRMEELFDSSTSVLIIPVVFTFISLSTEIALMLKNDLGDVF